MTFAKLKYRQIHLLEETPNISPVKISTYTVIGTGLAAIMILIYGHNMEQ